MDHTGTTHLPPDVQAALQRGDRLEAVRLLRVHLGSDPKAMPDVSAALERGDSAEAARRLREAVERLIGPPQDDSGRAPVELRSAAESLAPGQVPRPSVAKWLWWALLVVLTVVVIWLVRR